MHLQANIYSYSFSSCYICNSLPYNYSVLVCVCVCVCVCVPGWVMRGGRLETYLGAGILKVCPQILQY